MNSVCLARSAVAWWLICYPLVAHGVESQSQPACIFEKAEVQSTLGEAYGHALENLLLTNVVAADQHHRRSGLIADPPGSYVRAGAEYQEPWTRDASVNSWNAASLLAPALARNTLWAVCERLPNGKLTLQRDNQWWDKVVWVTAAWNHYATTGDEAFLALAYEAAETTLAELLATRFDSEYGLFQGASHLADGIAGFPEPFTDPPGSSSFILDHPGGDKLMSLSVNSLYYSAFRSMAKMALALKQDPAIAESWNRKAETLRNAINQRLWMKDKGSYAYFLHGIGALRGTQAKYQEATGLSLALLFGIPDPAMREQIFKNIRLTRWGIPLVDPEFARYSAQKPGRHSRIVWPMAQGYWATAAAKAGEVRLFQNEVEALAQLVKNSGWNFYEIYNPDTGKPDGGWQCGRHWDSCRHQTWSATAFIRMIHYGLFGMSFEPEGIAFAPVLPTGWGNVSLKGLPCRKMTLTVRLSGAGKCIDSVRLDGKVAQRAFIPATLTGAHELEIHLGDTGPTKSASTPSRSPAKGPLCVHQKNPRYFDDGTGRAVYLTGSHTWYNFQDGGATNPPPVLDFDRYLDWMVGLNHNFIRLWVWEQARWAPWADGKNGNASDWFIRPAWAYARTGPGQALDGEPKYDLTRFDKAYFDRLRERVQKAQAKGIYVSIMLFQGWSYAKGWLGGKPWPGHPYNPQNNLQCFNGNEHGTDGPDLSSKAVRDYHVAYLRRVVDAVNDLDNVLYEVMNEGGNKDWDWFVVDQVHAYEKTKPKQHPIGLTGHGSEPNDQMIASPADWFSPGEQSWPDLKANPRAVDGKKVSLVDTDHVYGVGGDQQWVWKCFLRGHNVLFMDPYMDRNWETVGGGGYDTTHENARKAMGITRRYAERMDLAVTVPHNELASTTYCLANPGQEYLIYLPKGGEVTVDLSAVSGRFSVEWCHPVAGAVTAGDPVEGQAKRTFTSPIPGEAVLYLRR